MMKILLVPALLLLRSLGTLAFVAKPPGRVFFFPSNSRTTVKQEALNLVTNEGGLTYVAMTHPSGASAKVFTYGADLTSYVDREDVEWLAVRPDAKLDGSKPISGGASHCFPQFGPGPMQQHGFARNVEWEIVKGTDFSVEMELKPNDYTKEMWDFPFTCRFAVFLTKNDLTTRFTVINDGDEVGSSTPSVGVPRPPAARDPLLSAVDPLLSAVSSYDPKPPEKKKDLSFEFQAGLHTYFDVSSIDAASVAGSFEGASYLDKMKDPPATETEARPEITVGEEYDRVYLGVNDPVLKDHGKNKQLKIHNRIGYKDTVIWNPYGNTAMGYDTFLCVESLALDPVHLEPGQGWIGEMCLTPQPLEQGGGLATPPLPEPAAPEDAGAPPAADAAADADAADAA